MRVAPEIHDSLAQILSYPAPDAAARLRVAARDVAEAVPETAPDLLSLQEMFRGQSGADLEELFTRTFDNNAERALEIGWQVHGETYDRGAFMVRMREMLREHGVEESPELPDHLSHALRLVGRMDRERAWKLVGQAVLPAVEKIQAGFGDTDNPYKGAIDAARRVLETHMIEWGEG